MFVPSQPIQRNKSLHEQTYETLRSSILAGELPSGVRLVETQLAQQLQVSRTPIREAVRQLQQEGLVTIDGSGLRVAAISVEDAVQLYDCRIALEQLSAQGACLHATSGQLMQLAQYVAAAEQLGHSSPDRKRTPSDQQLLDLDYRFHHLIAESSGNRWLVSLLEQVFSKMSLLRSQTTRYDPQVLEIRTEHRQIYSAIAQRDPAFAAQAISEHLTASKTRVVQRITQLQQVD